MTSRRGLLLITVVAAVPRIARLLFVDVVEGDGTEYCRLAERLLAGEGYRGMLAGEERMFPPLFPWLIAAAMQVFGVGSEVAARGLSFVSGLALPPLLATLTTRCTNRRAGLATGLIAALLPGFVLASAATYCEATQLVLFAGALLCLTSVARTGRVLPSASGGFLLGAAYLVRAESFVPAVLAGLLLAIPPVRDGRRPVAKPVLAFFVVFLVTCSPYPLYLHRVTGQLRIEGKSERVLATVERFAEGRPYYEANYALAPDDRGPWLDPNAPWDGPSKGAIIKRSGGAILWRTLKGMVGALILYASGHSVGSLLFFAAALFAFRGGGDRGRLFADLWLLALCAFFVFATGLYKPVLRYLLPLGLASAVFGGRAVDAVLRRYRPRRDDLGLAGLALVALLVASAGRGLVTGFREFGDAHPRHRPARTLGRLLSDHPEPGRIMSDDVRVAFHAKREWTPVPVAGDADLFVARLREQDVTLFCWNPRREDSATRPGPWFDPEDPPAALVPLAMPGPYRVFVVR